MTGVMAAVGRWRKRPLDTAMIKGKNFSSGSWTSLNLLMFGKRTWILKVILTAQWLINSSCQFVCCLFVLPFALHIAVESLGSTKTGECWPAATLAGTTVLRPLGLRANTRLGDADVWLSECEYIIMAPYFVVVDLYKKGVPVPLIVLFEYHQHVTWLHPVDLYVKIIIETFSGVTMVVFLATRYHHGQLRLTRYWIPWMRKPCTWAEG